MKHTPHTTEPWKLIDNYPDRHAIIPVTIHAPANNGLREVAQLLGEDQLENAQRIVSAVNSCAGLNPEAIPGLVRFVETVDTWLISPGLRPETIGLMRELAGKLLAQVKGGDK